MSREDREYIEHLDDMLVNDIDALAEEMGWDMVECPECSAGVDTSKHKKCPECGAEIKTE